MVLTKQRWGFLKLRFSYFHHFFSKISLLYPMENFKTSIISKISNRRAKRSGIWDLWVVVQHVYGAP